MTPLAWAAGLLLVVLAAWGLAAMASGGTKCQTAADCPESMPFCLDGVCRPPIARG